MASSSPTPPTAAGSTVVHPTVLEQGQAHDQPRSRQAFLQQLPTFKEFFHNEWKDLLPMLLVTVIAVPLNASPPIGKRMFPVPPNPEPVLDFSYPFRQQIITVPVSAVLAIFPPLAIFAVAQIRLKSYPDLHASVYGLLTTLVIGTFFQVILKSFIGGLRPYFYDTCRPDMSQVVDGGGQGYGGIMYGASICTGPEKDVTKALTSFPSGHSNAAIGSTVFVAMWLNAKLKIFADSRTRFWKLFFFFLVLIFGVTLCGTLTLDQSHHWYDVVAGGSIGFLSALAAYRTRYAAIWDFRFNHIPLPKSTFKHVERIDESNASPGDEEPINEKGGRIGGRRLKRRTITANSTTRTSKTGKVKITKYAQRYAYDLSKLNEHHIHSTALSHLHDDHVQPAPGGWLDPGLGAVPQKPNDPVLTRRWQGSALAIPGDATVTLNQVPIEGTPGVAHSPEEYGRHGPKRRERDVSTDRSAHTADTNDYTV